MPAALRVRNGVSMTDVFNKPESTLKLDQNTSPPPSPSPIPIPSPPPTHSPRTTIHRNGSLDGESNVWFDPINVVVTRSSIVTRDPIQNHTTFISAGPQYE